MFKALFNWVIHVLLFLIIFWGEKGTKWFNNKSKDFILMGAFIIVSGLVNIILNFYKRPILLSLDQKNNITKKDCTTYVRNETSSKQRTIQIQIKVTRQIGWNRLLNLYLKNKSIYILIETNPKGLHLQAQDEALKQDEIIPLPDGSGFFINITDFLKSINQHRSNGDIIKTEYYFIKETRENRDYLLNTDSSFYVNPVLVIDMNKRAPFWLTWALKWEPKEHKIEFYQNGRD